MFGLKTVAPAIPCTAGLWVSLTPEALAFMFVDGGGFDVGEAAHVVVARASAAVCSWKMPVENWLGPCESCR